MHYSRDRFRTAVNVWGDTVGAGIVAHLVSNDLPPLEDLKNYQKTTSDGYMLHSDSSSEFYDRIDDKCNGCINHGYEPEQKEVTMRM